MFKGSAYKVTEIEGAGLGIVSTRRIPRGEIILQEKPLVLVESKIKEVGGVCILQAWMKIHQNNDPD